MVYSAAELVRDIEAAGERPRFFDTWLLPPFLIFYAMRFREAPKNVRRALFVAGVWQFYRSFTLYRQAAQQATAYLRTGGGSDLGR
jgi:hypothetical protein